MGLCRAYEGRPGIQLGEGVLDVEGYKETASTEVAWKQASSKPVVIIREQKHWITMESKGKYTMKCVANLRPLTKRAKLLNVSINEFC